MCLTMQWLQNMQTRLPEMFERMESYGFTHSLSDSDMGYIFHKIVGIANQNLSSRGPAVRQEVRAQRTPRLLLVNNSFDRLPPSLHLS